MFSELLFNKTDLPVVTRSLDAAMLRSRAIANNIANVNTPGFRRTEVSFENELRQALDQTSLQGTQTDTRHLTLGRADVSGVAPKAYLPDDPTQPSGINNVDIDNEMAKLAETQIQYNYGIKFGQEIFKKLNAAIQEKSMPQ